MSVFVEESGDKQAPMMLFLHGGGLAGWMWEEQIDYFSRYHCVVVDLPGHGKSAHLPFSIKSCAKQLIELIETYAPGKETVLVGLSLGAQIGLEVLSSRPDLVQAAMINSANVRPSPTLKRWIQPCHSHDLSTRKKQIFFQAPSKSALYKGETF
jgi:pimeloyl-ACP methyl ester carboxylesterase